MQLCLSRLYDHLGFYVTTSLTLVMELEWFMNDPREGKQRREEPLLNIIKPNKIV